MGMKAHIKNIFWLMDEKMKYAVGVVKQSLKRLRWAAGVHISALIVKNKC
jgi:hypothetical protein